MVWRKYSTIRGTGSMHRIKILILFFYSIVLSDQAEPAAVPQMVFIVISPVECYTVINTTFCWKGGFHCMQLAEKWIWLPEFSHPEFQKTHLSAEATDGSDRYAVAEFKREYNFGKKIAEVQLRFSGDTEFRLYLGGELLATGPVNVGGDFLFNDIPRSKHYATEITLQPDSPTLSFFAQVKLSPVGINEYSRGRGGFMLSAKLTFADGRTKFIFTDDSWLCRLNRAFTAPDCFDQSLDTEGFIPAARIDNVWHCETAPIPPRTEEIIHPENGRITLAPGEETCADLAFDMIHAGFVCLNVQAKGNVEIQLQCIETEAFCGHYSLLFCRNGSFRGFQLQSAGLYRIRAKNHSDHEASIDAFMTATFYPVHSCAKTITSDAGLNQVMDVCRHTLKYCRQMIHLDSPKHSEPLACTGDYYIESLMTAMSFGDMMLAEFDIDRTAELLRIHDGRMFHTTYSLLWVQMLFDVYMITGNRALLQRNLDALTLLLDRFEGYIGENGLIETPPDFMFVDWIYIDDISMHHPPKALGQTCLCAFCYGALVTAARIFSELNLYADAAHCEQAAENLRNAVNKHLYDPEKELYCDGLNTPTPEHLLNKWLPQNVEKKYHMPHSSILCALYGLCDDDTARRIIRKVVADREWDAVQPYFAHYLLQAVDRLGLREECTLSLLESWKAPVRDCPKGLVEGFIAPEPTYSFDHSHAWGGTPLYSLPKQLSGLEIIEPGYRKIRLNPSLLGLEHARAEIPTPFGIITIEMKQNAEPTITAPDEIEIIR